MARIAPISVLQFWKRKEWASLENTEAFNIDAIQIKITKVESLDNFYKNVAYTFTKEGNVLLRWICLLIQVVVELIKFLESIDLIEDLILHKSWKYFRQMNFLAVLKLL